MINVNTALYELSYDDENVILIDKRTNELIIRVFSDNINQVNIKAPNSDVNISAKNINMKAKEYIEFNSELPENIASVFINTNKDEVDQIKQENAKVLRESELTFLSDKL